MDEKFISQYAKLDHAVSPMFIEPEGYTHVSSSRKRIQKSNMPTHDVALEILV